MSEEVMFADMLNHYSLKLSEINDLMVNSVRLLNNSVKITNESWSSQSANEFNVRMEKIKRKINSSSENLDNLLRLLNAVKDAALDQEIVELDQNIVID